MKRLQQIVLLLLLSFILIIQAQDDPTPAPTPVDLTVYNGKCVSCIQQNPSINYYCTKTNVCSATYIEYQSCEKGLTTCLNYKSKDLGVQEVPPYNKTHVYFNETIKDGQGIKFAVSNQDSKQKAWVEIQISEETTANKLENAPKQFQMYMFDPNNNTITSDYIFSRTGKTYIKPLTTLFYYAGANDGGYTLHVTYGNYKGALENIAMCLTLIISMSLLVYL